MLEYIILGYLMNGSLSGYELKNWMVTCTSNFFDASFGSIYPALKRLVEKGSISSSEVIEGGKYKKVYVIKEEGKKLFMDWLARPISFAKTRQDHLVQIYFYDLLPKEKAIYNLKILKEDVETVLNHLKELNSSYKCKYNTDRYSFKLSTGDYGMEYYQFIIHWCDNTMKRLEENEL